MLRASSSSIRVLAAGRESCITKDVAESNLKRNQKSGFSLDTNVIRSSDERVSNEDIDFVDFTDGNSEDTLLGFQFALWRLHYLSGSSR